MIPQRNISLLANRLAKAGCRIQESVLERDYCLAWFLSALAESDVKPVLAFKGGTALKRYYFSDYHQWRSVRAGTGSACLALAESLSDHRHHQRIQADAFLFSATGQPCMDRFGNAQSELTAGDCRGSGLRDRITEFLHR